MKHTDDSGPMAGARSTAARERRTARLGPCETRGCNRRVALEGACFCMPCGKRYVDEMTK